jgi:hypothetical protein
MVAANGEQTGVRFGLNTVSEFFGARYSGPVIALSYVGPDGDVVSADLGPYWRVREDSGYILMEDSADGVSWSLQDRHFFQGTTESGVHVEISIQAEYNPAIDVPVTSFQLLSIGP